MVHSSPSAVEIDQFIKKHGNKGSKILSMLGYNRKFIMAVASEEGRELLKDIMNQMDAILAKVIDLKANEAELAEYRAYRRIFNKWVTRIAKYNQHIDYVKQEGKVNGR